MEGRSQLRLLVTIFLSVIIVGASCIAFTVWSVSHNNRQWCELLTPLNSAYQSAERSSSGPPLTPTGKRVAHAVEVLHENFNC